MGGRDFPDTPAQACAQEAQACAEFCSAAMPWGRLVEAIALVAALHCVMAALCEEDGLPAKPVPQGRLMER